MRSPFVLLLPSLVLLGVIGAGLVLPAPAVIVAPSLLAAVFVLGGAMFCACIASRATDVPALGLAD
jgi:hypothetical protein